MSDASVAWTLSRTPVRVRMESGPVPGEHRRKNDKARLRDSTTTIGANVIANPQVAVILGDRGNQPILGTHHSELLDVLGSSRLGRHASTSPVELPRRGETVSSGRARLTIQGAAGIGRTPVTGWTGVTTKPRR